MKVVAITLTTIGDVDKAVVILQPNWLARLFGSPRREVRLFWDEEDCEWYSENTGRALDWLQDGALIRDALERMPIQGALPKARVVRGESGAESNCSDRGCTIPGCQAWHGVDA